MFKKDAITGWVILALGIVFIGMSIDPLMNDTAEFLRIMAMVLGGGIGSTIVIMWILNGTLPDDSNDQYETWLNNEFSEDTTKEKDNEDK
jgi:hypothetical protein